jgi:hypothetical protein
VRYTCAALRCINRLFFWVREESPGVDECGSSEARSACKSGTKAKGEEFEPSVDRKAHNGFRDHRFRGNRNRPGKKQADGIQPSTPR